MKKVLSFVFSHWYFLIWTLFCLFCYLSVFIPPTIFWPAVFLCYAIPVSIIINAFLLLITALFRSKTFWFPMLILGMGLPFIGVTVSYRGMDDLSEFDLSVLSFNAKFFRKEKTYMEYSREMIEWAVKDTSGVKCFQEFSMNRLESRYNTTKFMTDEGYTGYTHLVSPAFHINHIGMAMFSKYPVIDTGKVWNNHDSHNAAIFMDIIKGADTVRIYNVHLESMGLELYKLRETVAYDSKIRNILLKLRHGGTSRAVQIDSLISHVNRCQYPYIICGDFNDTPYSYNYFTLRQRFKNAFEYAGNGFGFTMNTLLFFLRIDHQFYNEPMRPVLFKVDRGMRISDHFPTRGYYKIDR